jgi:hypothetical protein
MIGIGKILTTGKTLAQEGKWRCKVCTFVNESTLTQCSKCHEAK